MTNNAKLHFWSISVASLIVFLVIAPLGQLAAQVAGY